MDTGAPLRDGHLVQYYEKEGFLFDKVTDFMSDGLRAFLALGAFGLREGWRLK